MKKWVQVLLEGAKEDRREYLYAVVDHHAGRALC